MHYFLYFALSFVLTYLFVTAAVHLVKIERVGDKMNVGLIKLDRPKALNALCGQLIQEVSPILN